MQERSILVNCHSHHQSDKFWIRSEIKILFKSPLPSYNLLSIVLSSSIIKGVISGVVKGSEDTKSKKIEEHKITKVGVVNIIKHIIKKDKPKNGKILDYVIDRYTGISYYDTKSRRELYDKALASLLTLQRHYSK